MGNSNQNQRPDRLIAIGDIHGCATSLKTLINAIRPGGRDLIVPLGDYVDRGPDSYNVIEQILDLSIRTTVVPLLGNHEIMMLGAIENRDLNFWLTCGGEETLASYGGRIEKIPRDHIVFLKRCRPYFETPDHIFLHANYEHDTPLDEQPHETLFWTHLPDSPTSRRVPPPHQSGKRVIVGHTPQSSGEVFDAGHVVGIDTYCFGGGWLTAMDVATGEIWQANEKGELREP